jgi:hypothetical protein
MPNVPKRVAERLGKSVPAFQRVLQAAKDRDVNESDTVTIITDILAQVCGFDKYTEVTSEQAIRGTFCDLAVQLDGKIQYLMEVKAIGLNLKENHLRQAVSYGANEGIPWVVLTNGINWDIYKIRFERPVDCDLVCSFNFLELNARNRDDQQMLFLLCREGLTKAAIEEYHEHVENVNRFIIAAILQTEPVLSVIRRQVRRVSPNVRVDTEEIGKILLSDVLKRDVVEGDAAKKAKARVKKGASTTLRKRRTEEEQLADTSPGVEPTGELPGD